VYVFSAIIYARILDGNEDEITLTSRRSSMLTFVEHYRRAKGNYTITAEANILPSETDTTDNTLTDGWIIVAIIGDPNRPRWMSRGKCDMRDVYEEPSTSRDRPLKNKTTVSFFVKID